MSSQLVEQMKVVLATVFTFYIKVHGFHWNVTGPNFPQYHKFLDDLYNEVWESIDSIGEHIRALDSFAVGSITRIQQLSAIEDQLNIITANEMFAELYRDNHIVLSQLQRALEFSEQTGNAAGLSNFLQDRIDTHNKHQWMLKATKGN